MFYKIHGFYDSCFLNNRRTATLVKVQSQNAWGEFDGHKETEWLQEAE